MTEPVSPHSDAPALALPGTGTSAEHIREFAVLDGLRGAAALAVALRHLPFIWPAAYPAGVLRESYLAVDFFFVLSGFVLAHAYSDRFRTGMSLTQFMLVRLVRLYPLYALSFLLALIVALIRVHYGKLGIADLGCNAVFAILFLPTLCGPQFLFPMNGAAWSLFFELVANLIFGWLGPRLNTLLLVIVVATCALTLLFAVPLRWFGFGTPFGPMAAGTGWDSFGAGLARVGYSFFAGVLVYRMWKIRAARTAFPSVAVIAALCVVLAAFPTEAYDSAFDLVATLLVFPVLVFLGACIQEDGRTRQLYSFLGDISYGVYVLQFPVFELTSFIILIVSGQKRAGVSIVFALTNLVLLVGLVVLAGRYFDRPIRRYLTRRLVAG
jgi:peptidoglycan/LPS O-acetylase OafA/YrhL